MNMMVPPKTPPKPITQETVRRIDEIGDRHGFVNREPPPEPFRRTKPSAVSTDMLVKLGEAAPGVRIGNAGAPGP